MLWSVYWHVQQNKSVEGFPGHVSCCGGRINMCRPDGSCWFGVGGATLGLLIVCGPRLMVMCFGVGPNGTTHDAFCSGVHHLMLLLHITAGLRAMDFGRVDVTVPMNDDGQRHCGCATTIHHVATTATTHVSPVTGPCVLSRREYVP